MVAVDVTMGKGANDVYPKHSAARAMETLVPYAGMSKVTGSKIDVLLLTSKPSLHQWLCMVDVLPYRRNSS